MKNLKKPTYDQKRRISKKGLDATQFLVKSDKNGQLSLINKETNEEIQING